MTAKEAIEFIQGERMDWCLCNDRAAAITTLRNVLGLMNEWANSSGVADIGDKIRDILGWNDRKGVALGYLYALEAAGLTDHGTSVGYNWLTPLGKSLLEGLEDIGDDIDSTYWV